VRPSPRPCRRAFPQNPVVVASGPAPARMPRVSPAPRTATISSRALIQRSPRITRCSTKANARPQPMVECVSGLRETTKATGSIVVFVVVGVSSTRAGASYRARPRPRNVAVPRIRLSKCTRPKGGGRRR